MDFGGTDFVPYRVVHRDFVVYVGTAVAVRMIATKAYTRARGAIATKCQACVKHLVNWKRVALAFYIYLHLSEAAVCNWRAAVRQGVAHVELEAIEQELVLTSQPAPFSTLLGLSAVSASHGPVFATLCACVHEVVQGSFDTPRP